jgi:hypothetical protein
MSSTSTREPWLIQRGRIQSDFSADNRISQAISMEYMGSAEFEFGALPQSLREMQAVAAKLSLIEVQQVRDAKGNPLYAYGNFQDHDPEVYKGILVALATDRIRTKESVGLDKQINPREIHPPSRCRTKKQKQEYIETQRMFDTSFWWDLNNAVMFSFDKKLMETLPDILKSSWRYMDEQKAVREAAKDQENDGPSFKR